MRSNVTCHIAVHSELMPFVCKQAGCDYRTRWLWNLRKHQKSYNKCYSQKRGFGKKKVKQEQSPEALDESGGSVKLEQLKEVLPEVVPEDGAK